MLTMQTITMYLMVGTNFELFESICVVSFRFYGESQNQRRYGCFVVGCWFRFSFLLFLFWLIVVCFAAYLDIESGFVVGVGSSIASVSSKRIFGVIVVVEFHFL